MLRLRLVTILVAVVLVAAAIIAAVTANPVHGFPSQARACTDCHGAAPASATVSASPSTSTPAAGATYTVAINLAGLTASGDTGYWITNAAGTPAVSVFAGDTGTNQTSYTQTMTAPSTPGTYTYTVWCDRGGHGQRRGQVDDLHHHGPRTAGTGACRPRSPASRRRTARPRPAWSSPAPTSAPAARCASAPPSPPTTAWSATQVTATVPASLAPGTTTVTVTPAGAAAASNGLGFTVDAPPAPVPAPAAAIASLSPTHGQTGDQRGHRRHQPRHQRHGALRRHRRHHHRLERDAGHRHGARLARPRHHHRDRDAGRRHGRPNGLGFTVDAPPAPVPAPVAAIASLSPTHGQTATSVVIAGTNLGTSGAVRFGATVATTTAWSATQVTATVPASLAPGTTTVTVTPAGATAATNGLVFTVDAPPAPVPRRRPGLTLSPRRPRLWARRGCGSTRPLSCGTR